MMVAGIGCRKGVETEAVLAGIDSALDRHRLDRTDLDALATVPLKHDEPALHAAARHLGLQLVVVTETQLKAAEARTLTRSTASLAHAGTPSAAEAAALAAAGPESLLLGPRIVAGAVTCAFAADGVRPQIGNEAP